MGVILEKFVDILCGDMDNRGQIAQEESEGKRIHPYAKHITRVCNERVKNKPEDLDGIFILEESYYQYQDQPLEIKPLFFYIREALDTILLQSIIVPDHLDKANVTNENPNLEFEYKELKFNEKFGVAQYNYHGDYFTVDHHCDFGNGITFRLVETLAPDRLEVMEMYMNNGQLITPYDTPLIYKKYFDEVG